MKEYPIIVMIAEEYEEGKYRTLKKGKCSTFVITEEHFHQKERLGEVLLKAIDEITKPL